jgi:hypothetical protein
MPVPNLGSMLGLLLALAAGEGEPRFGVAAISGTAACLASAGAPLAEGTAVTLVTPEKPQRVHRAVVKGRASACTTLERAGIGGPYYQVAAAPAEADAPLAVAILGAVRAAVVNDVAEVTFGATGEPLTVRSCTSREGVHLTAWRGKPREGRRVWHAYWYLGYDVEPSCTERDMAPTGCAASP